MAAFLPRAFSIAPHGYPRWRVVLAAFCVNLSIGQVYAFSVFNEPLARLIGRTEPAADDWSLATLGWVFSLAIAVLGLTAVVAGRLLERFGPRPLVLLSALCFGGGFLVTAAGIFLHQFWLLCLGYGLIGGVGLGLGYIAPVVTLMAWFPERPGFAAGLAIMGFGGGAVIASPLSVGLMALFATPTSVGVGETFVTLGVLYGTVILAGSALIRQPPPAPEPTQPAAPQGASRPDLTGDLSAAGAMRTPQFYLLWAMLCLNVTAGIGVISQAAAMIREMFPDVVTVALAASFVSVLSLANMAGRLGWATLSDLVGCKTVFTIFFVLGAALYSAVPSLGLGVWGAMLCFVVIISMYGGGFSTMPPLVKSVFGAGHFAAIYGRILTAWSVAGVLGPVLVNYLRDYQLNRGTPAIDAYAATMWVMAGLLLMGLACALALRPARPAPPLPGSGDTT